MQGIFICLVELYFLFPNTDLRQAKAEKETIIEVPYKKGSTWIWSWTRQWTQETDADGRVFYQVCDVSSNSGEPNKWIRSNVFHVVDTQRIDVRVTYSVSNCSSVSLAFCKEYLRLGVHKTAIHYSFLNRVPEPQTKPEVYEIFCTTSPSNLTTGSLSKSFVNTETYSFLTNSSAPNYYLAIQYQGGCFNLFSVIICYSVCPSLALPSSLIQLPRAIAPINGEIKVLGSCANNSQPLANNATLYGHCKANGEWISQAMRGECWCKAGYGKYLNGSGAVCKGQPSEPQDFRATFVNATIVVLQWKTSSNLGGRSDVYYEVECQKCNDEGKVCTMKCGGSEIIHSTKSKKATFKYLLAYTFYQFKVFARNGVSNLAEREGHNPKYEKIVLRTHETFKSLVHDTSDMTVLPLVTSG